MRPITMGKFFAVRNDRLTFLSCLLSHKSHWPPRHGMDATIEINTTSIDFNNEIISYLIRFSSYYERKTTKSRSFIFIIIQRWLTVFISTWDFCREVSSNWWLKRNGKWLKIKMTKSDWISGGQAILLGIINSYVHVIMYSYYFMTSFRPELKQSMWWKRYITQVQLIQFAVLFVHFLTPIFFNCGFSKLFSLLLALQNIFMLVLFGDFYIKTYIKKKPTTIKEGKWNLKF